MLGQEVSECPLAFIGDDLQAVRSIVEAAAFAKKGVMPAAGGTGDQTVAGLNGILAVWSADAEIQSKIDGGKTL